MEGQSIFNNKPIEALNDEFYDALEQFPFESLNSEEFHQSVSSSELDSKEEESTITIISEHSPESPSSPSSAGLRHRRPISSQSCQELSQSQFFKNNPDGLVDFDPYSTSLKDNEKLNKNLNFTTVHPSSDASSAVNGVSGDERINNESIKVNSPDSVHDLLFNLSELVIEVVGFQTKFLANSVKFPVWLIHSSYMLLNDPHEIIRICYNSGVRLINHLWFQNHESALKLCVRIGWGLLWLAYCGFILICLLVSAFLFSGMMMKWIVEEPIQLTEQLTFDYTKDTPMAFMPVISCPESSSLVYNRKSKTRSSVESRIIPIGHELMATVSLTLPESDYNRNLGIFLVRVDFLASDGTLLASIRKPCMLQFKSEPIRLLSTFVELASVLTGYPSETQTLDIKFSGYTEKDVPLSCSRVVIEQRAEFAKGDGVPEIYSASLKLESRFPFLKRMLWYWKGLIYMWISTMVFLIELLFTLLCCTPVIFLWVRRVGGSSINDAPHNMSPG
ncbi:hypothetical protein R6Q59_005118 [Mikania micrantha]